MANIFICLFIRTLFSRQLVAKLIIDIYLFGFYPIHALYRNLVSLLQSSICHELMILILCESACLRTCVRISILFHLFIIFFCSVRVFSFPLSLSHYNRSSLWLNVFITYDKNTHIHSTHGVTHSSNRRLW